MSIVKTEEISMDVAQHENQIAIVFTVPDHRTACSIYEAICEALESKDGSITLAQGLINVEPPGGHAVSGRG